MSRYGRILLNVVNVLSLLLLLAVTIAWATSYRWSVDLDFSEGSDLRLLSSQRGSIYLWLCRGGRFYSSSTCIKVDDARKLSRIVRVYGDDYDDGRLPVRILLSTGGVEDSKRIYAASDWLLAALAAALPACRFRNLWRNRRRRRLGICPACGYDLRATPDRCPECGQEAT
jgi:hypothetical protein